MALQGSVVVAMVANSCHPWRRYTSSFYRCIELPWWEASCKSLTFSSCPKETKEEWRLKAGIINLRMDGDLQNFRSATTKKADTKAPQNSHQTSRDKHWMALCVCLSHGTLEKVAIKLLVMKKLSMWRWQWWSLMKKFIPLHHYSREQNQEADGFLSTMAAWIEDGVGWCLVDREGDFCEHNPCQAPQIW